MIYELPSFRNYGQYSSDNYGVNSLQFDIPAIGLTIWYSYNTPVAFKTTRMGFVIRKNDWSKTTGKHLNWIDADKSKRIDGTEFEKKLEEALNAI